MTDYCDCSEEAGNMICELPIKDIQRPTLVSTACPVCSEKGKSVQVKTVRVMVSVSLREVDEGNYLFCKTETCPVVYFSSVNEKVFTIEQIREKVYQKHPEIEDTCICYCFRHKVGDIRNAPPQIHTEILDDINTGIRLEQCACDIRNPQGSCCLGNIRNVIKQTEKLSLKT